MENQDVLTPRQIEVLRSIIVEYIQTGEPVGSEILDKKYNLGVCPATVRNEMTELAKKGYIKKEHFSSGRIPTPQAFRFYVKNLIKEKELSTSEEVSYKNDVWDFRNQLHQFLQQTTRILAKKTNLLALTTTNLGDVYYFGVPNLFRQREFLDAELSKCFFSLFDESSFWQNMISQFRKIEEEILFVLGDEEVEEKIMEPCASILSRFEGKDINGVIGVMGSKRINYEEVVPQVKYSARLIEKILRGGGL
jgi:heat-inducible transcriptional repressor